MKKLIFFALLIWGGMLFISCGQSSKEQSSGKISEQGKKDYGNDYREAVKDGDFEAAHDILNKNYSNEAMVYINFQEIASLLEEDTANIVSKVNYILSDIQVQGSCCKEGYCEYKYAKHILEKDPSNEGEENAIKYIDFCEKYNELCDKVLNLAICKKNKALAESITDFYKPKISIYLEKNFWTANYARIDFSYESYYNSCAKIKEVFQQEKNESISSVSVDNEKKVETKEKVTTDNKRKNASKNKKRSSKHNKKK